MISSRSSPTSLQKPEGHLRPYQAPRLVQAASGTRTSEITDVECHIELRADLCTRTLCYGEELMKFPSTAPFEALGDIRHNRYGSSLNRSGKPEFPCKRSVLRNLIDRPSEISGFLPGNQIFKPVYLTQLIPQPQHCPLNCSRNSFRNTFPRALRGNADTNCTIAGFLKLASRW